MASTSLPRISGRSGRDVGPHPPDAGRQLTTDFPTIGGYRLRRLSSECGLDGAPTLVMLHGFSDSADTWRPMARYLRHRAHLVAVDLPSFGRSEQLQVGRATPDTPAPVYPELDRVVDAVLDHVDASTPGPVVLIGNSLGGALTLRAARRRPDLAAAIALAPANIGLRGWLGGPLLSGAKRVARLPLPHPLTRPFEAAAVAMTIPAHPARLTGLRQGWMFSNHMGAARMRHQLAIARRIIAESVSDFPTPDLPAPGARSTDVPASRTPVLLVVGDHDRLVTVERAQEAAAALGADTDVVVMSHTGHCPQSERPRKTAGYVLRLLEDRHVTGLPPTASA
ncbi:alpha/beta fold hydrolase [Millisia brevis]|uniref:alpha/beta fold hydrolase n=1 Tax=Millisia brevis TaxID=264148 RepID=UPI00083626E5|nr:alpha/beta hydrolase [Millisia brevis]